MVLIVQTVEELRYNEYSLQNFSHSNFSFFDEYLN